MNIHYKTRLLHLTDLCRYKLPHEKFVTVFLFRTHNQRNQIKFLRWLKIDFL